MKKAVVITLALIIVSALIPMQVFSQYAEGNAMGASLSGGTLSGISFTGKHEDYPIVVGAGLGYTSGNLGIGVTGDYWMLHNHLGKISDTVDTYLYLGPGVDLELILGNIFALDAGIRMPIGVSWLVDSNGWEPWEIFTELAVGVNVIGFITTDEYSTLSLLGLPLGQDVPFNVFNTLDVGFSVGFRYWL